MEKEIEIGDVLKYKGKTFRVGTITYSPDNLLIKAGLDSVASCFKPDDKTFDVDDFVRIKVNQTDFGFGVVERVDKTAHTVVVNGEYYRPNQLTHVHPKFKIGDRAQHDDGIGKIDWFKCHPYGFFYCIGDKWFHEDELSTPIEVLEERITALEKEVFK